MHGVAQATCKHQVQGDQGWTATKTGAPNAMAAAERQAALGLKTAG